MNEMPPEKNTPARRTRSDSDKTKLTPTQAEFLKVFEDCLGVVTAACHEFDISRNTYYEWYKHNPVFRAAADDINNVVLDFAENNLYSRIKEKSDTAIIFFLKTRGKKRGYVETSEVITRDGDLTDEERAARITAILERGRERGAR